MGQDGTGLNFLLFPSLLKSGIFHYTLWSNNINLIKHKIKVNLKIKNKLKFLMMKFKVMKNIMHRQETSFVLIRRRIYRIKKVGEKKLMHKYKLKLKFTINIG